MEIKKIKKFLISLVIVILFVGYEINDNNKTDSNNNGRGSNIKAISGQIKVGSGFNASL